MVNFTVDFSEARKTGNRNTNAVGSGDLLRFLASKPLFLALTNTNNKNNNKNRTHAHSHTPGDRRCGDPYAAAASADALPTRTGNDFRTPTHAHTRTQKQRDTLLLFPLLTGGTTTHASFFVDGSIAHTARTHAHTHAHTLDA